MDSAVAKIGLYDFFCIFLTGMIVLSLCLLIKLPILEAFDLNIENEALEILIFLLSGYFIGLVLQELSSYIDRKWWKFREKACLDLMNNIKPENKNQIEVEKRRILAKRLLQRETLETQYTKDECDYVYYYCKAMVSYSSIKESITAH